VIFLRKLNQKRPLRVEGLLILHPLPRYAAKITQKPEGSEWKHFRIIQTKNTPYWLFELDFSAVKTTRWQFPLSSRESRVLTSRDQDESAPE